MKKIVLIIFSCLILFSCDNNDGYTGEPDAINVPVETLNIAIATTETSVVSSQNFPITITLPKAFDIDVLVEVIAVLPNTNKRSRRNIIILKGVTVAEALMIAPSADIPDLPFIMNLELSISSITSGPEVTPPGFKGISYNVNSNKVMLEYGDAGFSVSNSNRLSIRLYNEFPSISATLPNFNNLSWNIKKVDGSPVTIAGNAQTTQPIYGTTTNLVSDVINFNRDADNIVYIINVFALKLITAPTNLKYKLVVRYPDDKVRVFAGTLNNLSVTTATGAIPLFRVTKSLDSNNDPFYLVQKI